MTIAIFVFSLCGAMALGMPIAFALIACGVALMFHLSMFDTQIIAQNLINGADSFPLMAIPFFMLAGATMNAGGLSKRIIHVAMTLVGHIRGGLGYVVILAACILASLSGSAAADAAAMSALLFPMMVKSGYDPVKSSGLIAAGSIIGPMVPPSPGLIVFGVTAGLSITKLFMAAIVPGIMIAIGIAVAWWWVTRKMVLEIPPRASAREVFKAIREGLWALVMPAILVFGLKFGIFTPTEAGVVCSAYALFVSLFIYKDLKFSQIYGVLAQAGQTAVDPIYFGVIFIINNAIGLVTPPVGTTLNVVCGVTKVKMDDIIVGVWPFMVAQLVVMTLLILFPDLVLVPMRWFMG